MNEIMTRVVVLAAGKGTRMNSELAKVLHKINGRPMIVQVLETIKKINPQEIYLIIGHQAEKVAAESVVFNPICVEQKEQLGTGHAVMMVAPQLTGRDGITIVTCGDVPLLRAETLQALKKEHLQSGVVATIITARLDDAAHYGRIIRDQAGLVSKIVEYRDANNEERACREINSGIYCFNTAELFAAIKQISANNDQREYYLTDVIEILKTQGLSVGAYLIKDNDEIHGINTVEDLARAEKINNSRLALSGNQ